MRRLRWRLRGALQWPLFAVTLVAQSVLLHELPPAGDGISVVGAVLLAGLVNLVVVGVIAPLASLPVRRPELPRGVARDYCAAVLLVLATAVVGVLGLAHRPAIRAARAAFAAQSQAARAFVDRQQPAYRAGLARATTLKLDAHLFRTCVPGRGRFLCMMVDVSERPPGVTLDPSGTPNSDYIAP